MASEWLWVANHRFYFKTIYCNVFFSIVQIISTSIYAISIQNSGFFDTKTWNSLLDISDKYFLLKIINWNHSYLVKYIYSYSIHTSPWCVAKIIGSIVLNGINQVCMCHTLLLVYSISAKYHSTGLL